MGPPFIFVGLLNFLPFRLCNSDSSTPDLHTAAGLSPHSAAVFLPFPKGGAQIFSKMGLTTVVSCGKLYLTQRLEVTNRKFNPDWLA